MAQTTLNVTAWLSRSVFSLSGAGHVRADYVCPCGLPEDYPSTIIFVAVGVAEIRRNIY